MLNRTNLIFNLNLVVNELIYPTVHIIAYYRYNGLIYRKFPVDLYEDFCEWIENRNKTGWLDQRKYFFLEFAFGIILDYTNFNHPCPYVGSVYIENAQISIKLMQNTLKHLVPAGRYFVEFSMAHKNRTKVYFSGKVYFTISDHRIEQF